MLTRRLLVLLAALCLAQGGYADTSWTRSEVQMNVELREDQLPKFYDEDVAAGKVPGGAEFMPTILLRAGSASSGALVATHGFSVLHSGEMILSDLSDIQVRFSDGRAWVSVGNKIPYVDGEGRLFLLDPEQVFGMPASGGDQVEDRIPLEDVLADPAAFSAGE